jgi:hypothetical protein
MKLNEDVKHSKRQALSIRDTCQQLITPFIHSLGQLLEREGTPVTPHLQFNISLA